MKRILRNLLFLSAVTALLLMPATSIAQNPEEEEANGRSSLLERIEEESEGNVTFEIPDIITEQIFTTPSAPKRRADNPTPRRQHGIQKREGYRIQVFNDGRNQASLQARAKARGNAVVSRFPKYRGQIYTFSSAPNWYTRVGNFKTQAEASAAMSELKRAFPSFAGEMRVVKCQIVLVK